MSLFNINRLILRSGTSPYGDTIRNAVLKWEDVDGNFLTLKGGLIEDITLSGNNLTFTTVDNQIIDIDLTGATCSGIYADDIYNCSGDLTVWSDLTVNGNVVINGSATTINTEIIQAEDNNIVLNYSGTTASANGGGMTVLEAQGAGIPSTITVDENGCWHVDPGFCDLTVDGIPFTAQTPYLFVDDGSVNSITTRYTGNTVTDSDYSNIGGGKDNTIDPGSDYSNIAGGLNNLIDDYTKYSVIGGGYYNVINSGNNKFSNSNSIIGGKSNYIGFSGLSSIGISTNIIGNGLGNSIYSQYSSIGNGFDNRIGRNAKPYPGLSPILEIGSNSDVVNSIVSGWQNEISGSFNSIGHGLGNNISVGTINGTIAGGWYNELYTTGSEYQPYTFSRWGIGQFIGGGQNNYIGGTTSFSPNINFDQQSKDSSIVGGNGNTIYRSDRSFIGGGWSNEINSKSRYSVLVGGINNKIETGQQSLIVGGARNYVNDSYYCAIVGGRDNEINSPGFATNDQFIGGGRENKILGIGFGYLSNYSSIIGGQLNTITASTHSIIGGGKNNTIQNNSDYSGIVGGEQNTLEGTRSFIGGGKNNSTNGSYTFIGSGKYNQIVSTADPFTAMIGGGQSNTISLGKDTTIVGGINNEINIGVRGFIGGGGNNYIGDTTDAVIAGGLNNRISGNTSSIVGGQNNVVSHTNSHIIGSNITSISANTTHVERFNIGTIDNNESLNDVLVRDTDGTVRYRSSQSIADSFTGNTSGDCITDLYVTNLYGCSPLHIEPSGLNDVYIVENGGGMVGVGTSAPTARLHISGNTRHSGDIFMDNGEYIEWNDNTGIWPTSVDNKIRWRLNNDSAEIYAWQSSSNDIDFVFKLADDATTSTDNYVFWIDNTGAVGGETNDRYPLEMNGSQFIVNALRRYATSPSNSGASKTNFYVLKSGATALSESILHANVITNRVGVNTSSPTETLDVNGNTIISGTLNIGTVTTGSSSTDVFVRESNGMVNTSPISSLLSAAGVVEQLNDLSDVTIDMLPYSATTQADDGKLLFYEKDTEQWIVNDTVTHGTSVINGKKSTAGTLQIGTPVYLIGFDNDLHTVEAANATTATTMPCIGLVAETMDNVNSKHIMTFGKLQGVDTTTGSTINPNNETWNINDDLYVSTTTGGLTKFRPTGAATQIQRIAKVLKVSDTDGQLLIYNTARTAGLPNLTENYIWVGDSNNQPVETALSSFTQQKYAASIPFTAATPQTITHNLNDTDVIVQLKDSTGTLVIPNVVDNYTNNTVDIEVSSTETFRVIIIG